MKNRVRLQECLNYFVVMFFVFLMFGTSTAFAVSGFTTYQAKIIKPNGQPLEAPSVNFRFTILNPDGDCKLYSEFFANVNMTATGGLVSFSLGSGIKTFPSSSTTFAEVFSNVTPNLTCDAGGPTDYSPAASDTRKIIMQFQDSSGWQTLPAMTINAVPYAMYASEAQTISGLPSCSPGQALTYNGASFSCESVSGGGVTSSTIIAALGFEPVPPASLTSINAVGSNNTLPTISSNSYALGSNNSQNTGGGGSNNSVLLGFSNQIDNGGGGSNSGYVFGYNNRVYSNGSGGNEAFIFGSNNTVQYSGFVIGRGVSGPATNAIVIGNGHQTINVMSDNRVGIGTSSPVTTLDVSGGVRIGAESATCDSTRAGTLRYNGSSLEFCNGTNWGGFSGSVTSSTVITALGYTPASSSTLDSTIANLSSVSATAYSVSSTVNSLSSMVSTISTSVANISSSLTALTNVVSAMTTSQWVASGTGIHYNSGHVGIGTQASNYRLEVSGTSKFLGKALFGNTPATSGINFGPALGLDASYESPLVVQNTIYDQTSTYKFGFGSSLILDSPTPTAMATTNFGSFSLIQTKQSNATDYLFAYGAYGSAEHAGSGSVTDLGGVGGLAIANTSGTIMNLRGVEGRAYIVAGDVTNANGGEFAVLNTSPTHTGFNAFGVRILSTTGSFTNNYGLYIGDQGVVSATNSYNILSDGSGRNVFIGQVGIGTSMPNANYKLHVHNTNSGQTVGMISTDGASNAVLHVASDLDGAARIGSIGYHYSQNILKIVNDGSFNSSTKGLAINPNGLVGVGVMAPNAYLHVAAGTSAAAALKLVSGTLLASPASGAVEYDGFNLYYTDGTNARRTVATTANVAAAVTSSSIATALGYAPVSNAVVTALSGTVTTLQNTVASMSSSQWNSSGTQISYSAGNVGVGTSNPSQALDVSGSVRANKFFAGDGAWNSPSITFANNSNTGFYNASGWLGISVAGGLQGTWTSSSLGFNAGGAGPQIYFTGGNAANPSYAFNVDSDTGMFNPNGSGGSNELAFSTSGVERVRISSAGTVGIGTSSPATMLDVVKSGANDPIAQFGSAGAADSQTLKIKNGSGETSLGVAGNTSQLLTGSAQGDSVLRTAVGKKLLIGSSSQTTLTINNSLGSVGIGTTAATVPLDVNHASDSRIYVSENGTPRAVIQATAGEARYWGLGSAPMVFLTNSVERIRVTSAGAMGVGVVVPTAKLHLTAGTSSVAALKMTSGTLLTTPQAGALEYDGNYFWITDGLGVRRTIVADDGSGAFYGVNYLISNTNMAVVPTGSFVVSSTTAATSYTNGALVVKGGMGVAGDSFLRGNLSVSGSSRFTGPVGVGTSTPGADLEVRGILRVSSSTSSYMELQPAQDISTLNPGTITPTAGILQGTLNSSMIIDLRNNNVDDAFAIRYSASQTANVDAIGFVMNGAGRVGIGTSNPTGVLDVRGGTASGSTNGAPITLAAQAAGSGNQNGGNINLIPGAATGTGSKGSVQVGTGTFYNAAHLEVAGGAPGLAINNTGNSQILLNHGAGGWGAIGNNSAGKWSLGYTDSGSKDLDHSVLTWTSSGNTGIGTTSPSHVLDVVDNGNDAGMKFTEHSNSYPADFRIYRSRGTQAGPSALQSGDIIGGLQFYGYGNAALPTQRSAAIEVIAAQNYTATERGAEMVFKVAASGTTATTEALRIAHNGYLGLGTSAPATKLNIGGFGAMNATALRIDSQDTYYRDIFMSEFNTTSYGGILRYHSGADLLQLITMEAGVEKYGVAVARATGFVGIGMNSAASYQLDVNGDIRITGTPYRAGGDIAWTVPSDARLKDVVGKYNRGLREIANIDTIIYKYKKDNPKQADSTHEYTGVLAQQVQKQIPEAVNTDKDGFLSLNTTPIFWAMLNALKEVYYDIVGIKAENAQLKAQTQTQARKIQSLEEENAAIKERLDRIEKSLNQQK